MEQNGGTYTLQGDYLFPDIKLLEQPELKSAYGAIAADNTSGRTTESNITIC